MLNLLSTFLSHIVTLGFPGDEVTEYISKAIIFPLVGCCWQSVIMTTMKFLIFFLISWMFILNEISLMEF